MEMRRMAAESEEKNVIYAFEPDRSLREKIGKDVPLENVFEEDRIAACQKLIDDAREGFFDSAAADMRLLEKTVAMGDEALKRQDIRRAVRPANQIKGQANAFGLPFVSLISSALVECCEAEDSDAPRNRRLIVKLVEALSLAFREKILDEGGDLGKAVLESLRLTR